MIYIDQATGKLVNIHAPYKGRSRLDTPEIRAEVGVVSIERDAPPDEYNDHPDWYNVQEDWEATKPPYVIFDRKPQEMIDRAEQEKTNRQSLAYLASTDWYVLRFAETGTPIPDDVKTKRQAARDAVVYFQEVAP